MKKWPDPRRNNATLPVTLCTQRDCAIVTIRVNRRGLVLILNTIDAESCPSTSS